MKIKKETIELIEEINAEAGLRFSIFVLAIVLLVAVSKWVGWI